MHIHSDARSLKSNQNLPIPVWKWLSFPQLLTATPASLQLVCARKLPGDRAESSEVMLQGQFLELFPYFLMQPHVTLLSPSKHGNGSRKTLAYVWKKKEKKAGLGLQFEFRNLLVVFVLYQVLFCWRIDEEISKKKGSQLCKIHYVSSCFQNGQVPKKAENIWSSVILTALSMEGRLNLISCKCLSFSCGSFWLGGREERPSSCYWLTHQCLTFRKPLITLEV